MIDEVVKLIFNVVDKGLTEAEKKVKSLNDSVQEAGKKSGVSLKGLGGAFGSVAVAAGAAGAAVLVFGKNTLDAAKEIDQLSRRAGISADEFQRQAFAARTVGIEQDKYADILKDVNDKVGDFLTTGAGPMKDFFDTIGRKVGVTAEDFKNLSGDQALGLYVDTLQKAGANQQEVAFHMEALASDSTLLAPLLANNAAEMNKFGDAAGNVLSQEQTDNAKALNDAMASMSSTITNQLKGAFIDVATEAANFFNLLGTEAEKAAKRNIADLDDQIVDLQESLKELADNEVDGVAASFAKLNDIEFANRIGDDITENNAERLRAILEQQLQLKKQAQLSAYDTLGSAQAEAKAQKEITDEVSKRGFGTGSGTSVAQTEAEEKMLEIQEIKVTAVKRERSAKETIAEIDRQLLQLEQDRKDEIIAQKVEWGLLTDFASVHLSEMRELQEALAKGTITAEEYGQAILNIAKDDQGENPWAGLTDELTSLETKMKEMRSDAIVGIADGFAEMAVSGKSSFREMAASMLKDIAKLILKTLILRAISSFLPGAGGPITIPSVPGLANGGVTTGATLVGERGPELIMPASQSRVVPNHAMNGSGGNSINVGSINVTVQEKEGETSEEQAARIGKQIKQEMRSLVINELNNQSRKGNMLNPAPVKAFR